MILNFDNVLLFIEPKNDKSVEPVDDELTLFVEKLLNDAIANKSKTMGVVMNDGSWYDGVSTKGWHVCRCKQTSSPHDYEIYKGFYTNSLAAHYLRFHRNDVPEVELNKVRLLMEKASEKL
ncbi:MAG: hypothetical protein Terrestrivirus4_178 [Terrestrivirus sp.]|uniref:Uncharacterized protein n=1 Tax=Terrestrivirus sp. TaxID=2487775 RepID=A0A3G4ZMQ3_9VIRU|nr:MAG: hypothetical protein Terrestrivirus4_178 [Terrestrivirus sp.]